MKLHPLQEREAIKKLKGGNPQAFNQLFYAYQNRLYGYAFSLLADQVEAEGIVQEVFFRVWKNRSQLDETKSFKSFLFTISKNLIFNTLQKCATRKAFVQNHLLHQPQVVVQSDSLYEYHELETIIGKVVSAMPMKRKQVFVMSRFQGLNNREIAKQLDISLSTVENHINKALKAIKEQLTSYDILFVLFIIHFF